MLGPGYWNLARHTEQTSARRAAASASPLSAYQSALDDVAAVRRASKNAGE